jgi:hypothetical protein
MNESPDQEKDFRSILNSFQQLGEQRDKLISEIDEIIDRIHQNRKPMVEPSTEDGLLAKPSVPVVVPVLRQRVREMDLANEKLKAISNRLNELA